MALVGQGMLPTGCPTTNEVRTAAIIFGMANTIIIQSIVVGYAGLNS